VNVQQTKQKLDGHVSVCFLCYAEELEMSEVKQKMELLMHFFCSVSRFFFFNIEFYDLF